jgi:hypothetical protein
MCSALKIRLHPGSLCQPGLLPKAELSAELRRVRPETTAHWGPASQVDWSLQEALWETRPEV